MEQEPRYEHSVFSVPTRAPTPKPGVEAQRLRRRWAALGGLALLGAAACWWWV